MATHTHLSDVLTQLAELLEQTGTSHDEQPTPCSEFTVAELRHHVVGWLTAFADGFADGDGNCSDPDAVVVHGDGAAQVREQRDRIAQALADGAGQRELKIGGAGMPGDMALSMILGEYHLHGWDLARATGRTWDPVGVQESLDFFPAMLTPDFQGEGKTFGPRVDVAADTPAMDRLAGLTGRDPAWNR